MDDWPTPEQYWKAHKWEFIHYGLMILVLMPIVVFQPAWTTRHPLLTLFLVTVPVALFTMPRIWKSERY